MCLIIENVNLFIISINIKRFNVNLISGVTKASPAFYGY